MPFEAGISAQKARACLKFYLLEYHVDGFVVNPYNVPWDELNADPLLKEVKRVHFIGIGGSGMCPLAEILHSWGYELSGSDNNESDTLDRIRKLGIPVTMGQ